MRNRQKKFNSRRRQITTHTGFENTRKMLQILYGENYKFNIWSEKGKGTKIEIILPAERGEIPCGKQ